MSGKNWVILVAGTKGWDNYRDQANVCCAYQLIKKHGIPPDQIVVMMYNDIANNPKNPTKGSIVSVLDELDVYKNVPKNYTQENVTPQNFLDVLQGNDSAGGKVIKSGSQDNIFIYMSGTGQGSTFDFPGNSLLISDFIGAIKNMIDKKKFAQMVIYMECTNSSSMFSGLSNTTNAYAVTSGDSNPSNWDLTRNVYRSDDFSAALLTNLSKTNWNTLTLSDLNSVFPKTYKEFGDKTISSCFLSKFLENQ